MADLLQLLFLANLALSVYLVGAVWAIEVGIFRSWKLVRSHDFATVQTPWRKLPYRIFIPPALALLQAIVLVRDRPAGSPANWLTSFSRRFFGAGGKRN